jgi:hypothetical protein
MLSSSVTPSTLGGIVSDPNQSTPSDYVSQSSANPPAQVADPGIASDSRRLNDVLLRIASPRNASQPTVESGGTATSADDANNTSSGQPGGWRSALGKVVSAGLSSIPQGGRASFIGGLGQGARSEQANQAAIKMASFQDAHQAAQLHNEDIRMQNATDEHQTAVQNQADAEAKRMTDTTGMTYTDVPNTAANVTEYMAADTAQNGAGTVPSGVIFGPHVLHIPNKGSADQAKADTQNYNMLAGAYGKATVQQGQVVNPAANNMLRQTRNGMDQNGNPLSAADIGNRVDSLQSYLKANSGLTADATSAIQSDIDHLTDLQVHHAARDQAGIAQATSDAVDKASKLGAIKTSNTEQVDDNKAGNKTQKTDAQMYVGSDASGNQVAGTSDDLKAAGVQGFTKMGASAGEKVTQAREMISPDGLFSAVAKDVADLQAKGKLGVAASRWSEFMGGTVGTDPDFAPLRTDMGLLSTKLMQVHVGARGSAEMLHHFANLADYKISDAPTLTAALKAEYRYIHGAAMLPKKTGGQ